MISQLTQCADRIRLIGQILKFVAVPRMQKLYCLHMGAGIFVLMECANTLIVKEKAQFVIDTNMFWDVL